MRYTKQILVLLTVAVASLLTGCGQQSNCSGISFGNGSGGGTSSGGGGVNSGGSVCGPGSNNNGGSFNDLFFYHGSNGPNNSINTASVTATTFAVLPGIATNVGQSIVGSVIIVNKKFLYLPDQNGSGGVMGFTINHSSGVLTAIAGSPFAVAPSQITTLAADPDANGGRYLFAADFTSGDFVVFTIDATTGVLTPVSGSPFPTQSTPSRLKVDGTGHYLYASEGSSTGNIFGYLIDQNSGALSPIVGSPFGALANTIDVDSNGQFLLAVASGGAQIDVIPIEQGTGSLLLNSASSFPTAASVDGAVFSPSGQFVYAFGGKNPLQGFQFSAGTLTELNGSPYSSLPFLTDCQFDQAGSHLFGIRIPSSSVGVYVVDPTTGAVTAPLADPGIVASPYFAPTN
jgi:6-phosphogluconolactonase (cycloisomerase 2 family)